MALDWKAAAQEKKAALPHKVVHAPVKSRIRAQQFSAMTGPETETSKLEHIESLKALRATLQQGGSSPEPLPMDEELLLLSEAIGHVWAVWLHVDHELSLLLGACQQERDDSSEHGAMSSTCTQQIELKLEERKTWRQIATPQLELTRTRAMHWSRVASVEADPLARPLRAQSLYYQAAMALTLQQDDEAQALLEQLITWDKESPYAAFTYMSLADRLLDADKVESASHIYLQAMAHDHNPARAYAMYRQAECLLRQGDWAEGMRVLILAVEELERKGGRMILSRELSREVMLEILELYAQTGAPGDAPGFFAALGVPDTVVPIYIERLAGRYAAHGREEEARLLRKALERLDEPTQESPSGEGTSMPRSR